MFCHHDKTSFELNSDEKTFEDIVVCVFLLFDFVSNIDVNSACEPNVYTFMFFLQSNCLFYEFDLINYSLLVKLLMVAETKL